MKKISLKSLLLVAMVVGLVSASAVSCSSSRATCMAKRTSNHIR